MTQHMIYKPYVEPKTYLDWKSLHIGWDEILPAKLADEWSRCIHGLKTLDGFSVQQRIEGNGPGQIQLHGFCDARERAYGACVYMRFDNQANEKQMNLICSKLLRSRRSQFPGLSYVEHNYWLSYYKRAANRKLPVFVAHRVGEIQESTSVEDWHHVGSRDNAADILSRGCKPEELSSSALWWNGPAWLRYQDHLKIIDQPETMGDPRLDEERRIRLIRVIATCIRLARLRKKELTKPLRAISMEELEHAKRCVVGMEQRRVFSKELSELMNSRLVELIVEHEHERNFHADTDATLTAIRQLYWPLRARGTVRKVLRRCILCFRARPRLSQKIMGDLPGSRVIPARPFKAALTFEEANTLITQIEVILNSRPLTALFSDYDDLNCLTPNHFLIGNSLTSYPELDLEHLKINKLSRWQLLERMRQQFWKRWTLEYLSNLQARTKWQTNREPPIEIGQLVLCKEEGLPPLKWALGRIQEVCLGKDNVTRVVVVKTAAGTYKRPAAKICILPMEKSDDVKDL
ncbi:uncharacterized protein [Anoplolepis gracilipes]|uniref:uncharacterized protein n=1 Tax=Anoplolepis gracilipes TaxID=354296 RepID=UPI003BA2426D